MNSKIILFSLILLIFGITIVYADTIIYKQACRINQPKSICFLDKINTWKCINNNDLQCEGNSCPNHACQKNGQKLSNSRLNSVSGTVSVKSPVKTVAVNTISKNTITKTSSVTNKAVSQLSSSNGLGETRIYKDGCRFTAGKYMPKSNCYTEDSNEWSCVNNRLQQEGGLDLKCKGKFCPPYACRIMGVTSVVTAMATAKKTVTK